jgi:hypothetical protein
MKSTTHEKKPLWAAAWILLLLASLTGCASYVPFTQELRSENALSKDDIRHLQFYSSDTITLRREIDSATSHVTGGHKLLLLSGKTIEEVEIAAKTPGVAVGISDRSVAVSFAPGTSIVFSTAGEGDAAPSDTPVIAFAEPPDPFPGNDGVRGRAPELLPTHSLGGGGSYFLATTSASEVMFEGRPFTVVGDGAKAHLLIDAEKLREVAKSKKVLSGVRLPAR